MPELEKAAHRLSDIHAPYQIYKSDISYFSGKLEAYLRYKAIPHSTVDANNEKHACRGRKYRLQKNARGADGR